MKKIIAILISMLFIIFMLCACDPPRQIVKKTPIETSFQEAYDSVETDYNYKYNWLEDEFVLVPDTHTVHHSAQYKVKYYIKYDDGTHETVWEPVNYNEYSKARDNLPP